LQRKLDIPGPHQLPILCNLLDALRHYQHMHDYVLEQVVKVKATADAVVEVPTF
jgi:hypothetical protein